MVRILTCHHFGGQKIGKCEEALQLAVADDLIIVALEHQVAVYSSDFSGADNTRSGRSKQKQGTTRDGGDIGSTPIFFPRKGGSDDPARTGSGQSSGGGNELILSHSFPTVDLIDSISYNDRGNYLLCVEKRESSGQDAKKLTRSVRVYFNWDTSKEGKPMRARIASLVSPTGADPDDDTLVMVEISTTSPTGSGTPPNVVAASSCSILGHLATLTDAGVVNIYAFKLKETKGRASKSQYSDFDFSYAIEVFGFSPETARLCFLADIITVSNSTQVNVIRLTKHARARSRTASTESGGSLSSSGRRSVISGALNSHGPASLPLLHKPEDVCDKVVFDPKNESVKVHMNVITRANQKARFPDAATGIYEEYQEMVAGKSKLIFAANAPTLVVEDLLRIHVGQETSVTVVQVGLYPVKIKDDLGGISCIVGMSSQAFVYHLPAKLDCNVVRVVTYPLTAPLVSFAFDSLFFHALTETGLETYTSRSLYYPLKEFEGFQRHKNDCPFLYETPSLVGIRPFIGVRYMAANEFLLCLLASPSSQTSGLPTPSEDNLWTIYALQLPSIDLLCEDLSKAAKAAKDGNLDTYVTLSSELHLVLRTYMNMYPEKEGHFLKDYRKTCKTIGVECLKRAAVKSDEATFLSEGRDKFTVESQAEELVDRGVTFLVMAGVDLKHIFEEDPLFFLKDHYMIRGVTRFISAILKSVDSNTEPLSPKLLATITDFLVTNSPDTLVNLVTEVPLLRETNSAKLIQTIRKLAEGSSYNRNECVALLLTVVTSGGCDIGTRNIVKEVLQKCNKIKDLENSFDLKWLLDLKVAAKSKLTDLAICLSASHSSIPVSVIVKGLEESKVTVGQVMMAFSQGINLSSDLDVQNSLTHTLTSILEKYFMEKLKLSATTKPITNHSGNCTNVESKINYENELISSKVTPKPTLPVLELSDDETHAVNTLVRSYISRISLKPSQEQGTQQRRNSADKGQGSPAKVETRTDAKQAKKAALPTHGGSSNPHSDIGTSSGEDAIKAYSRPAEPAGKILLTEMKVTPFGKVPNFFVHIFKATHTQVSSNASVFQVVATFPGASDETKEYFLKLSSLLASPLGNAVGARDVVLNFLETKGQAGTPLHVCLEMLADPYDKAIPALMNKYPLSLMYYAKETFGRSTPKWKLLVTKLKEKIYDNAEDVEVFATIIESVYLYVANTLSPTELEEVLDKGEENSRFFKACRRTELANSYNQMIVQMSNEYL